MNYTYYFKRGKAAKTCSREPLSRSNQGLMAQANQMGPLRKVPGAPRSSRMRRALAPRPAAGQSSKKSWSHRTRVAAP